VSQCLPRTFIDCAVLLAMATPAQKTFTAYVSQIENVPVNMK